MQHMIIGRGMVGWHSTGVEGGHRCSSSGGDLDNYLSEADDGTPIYDASETDEDKFCTFVVSGPIVDPSLPSGTLCGWGEPRPFVASEADKVSGFDNAATDVYLTLLRERVPGVKFGKVVNHQIVWE